MPQTGGPSFRSGFVGPQWTGLHELEMGEIRGPRIAKYIPRCRSTITSVYARQRNEMIDGRCAHDYHSLALYPGMGLQSPVFVPAYADSHESRMTAASQKYLCCDRLRKTPGEQRNTPAYSRNGPGYTPGREGEVSSLRGRVKTLR
jgi:hypothetical protein